MRPFIILELLIAFALVSASALPLIRYPLQHLAREIDALFLTELSRLAEADLAGVRVDHLCGKLDLEKRTGEKFIILLPGDLKRSFEKKISLQIERKKETKDGEVILLKARIAYRPVGARKAVLQAETVIFSEEQKKP